MKFFKYMMLVSIVLSSFVSCMRDPEVFDFQAQWEMEKATIREYVAKNYPNAIEHRETGIWYEFEKGDTDYERYEYRFNEQINDYVYPYVTVHYKLRLLTSDQIVEETVDQEPARFELSRLILAWRIAFFPQEIGERQVGGLLEDGLQVGDKIRLFTPSRYAYGNEASSRVPANSPLFFEIEVLDIEE